MLNNIYSSLNSKNANYLRANVGRGRRIALERMMTTRQRRGALMQPLVSEVARALQRETPTTMMMMMMHERHCWFNCYDN